ncbi:hypothetical protein H072_3731 [Dactylellina haptotyla CBS 200.50]|uniref:Uncharacterized protein n=1 Tax=Dactylellina haptotyla (strain CBS 200.50) TaxID=1284197 RepID=S8AHG4_DACHA|nr:hypothetical protein H072_3731 [Dactylellina haptotyla CBS 200.50]
MSSRALRKAQQRAEEERLAALAAPPPTRDDGEDDDDGEEEEALPTSTKPNLFAMLNAELEEAEADHDGQEEEDEDEPEEKPAASSKPKKKNKKKKKKGKSKAKEAEETKDEDDDDFDSALAQALKLSTISSTDGSTRPAGTASDASQLQALLHIDPRHLDLENEMRKLFGRVATSREATDTRQQARGQRLPGGRQVLASGGRRNVFVQAGDNWPRESSGGLAMELVEKNTEDSTVLFRYVHSRVYQDIQRHFNDCVRSMDPDRMVLHLQSHPYHVSTLLQTSQIALTHQNDPTTSQTLISRALFSLGRSSHSVFPTSLASGLARLSFIHFENRELYFAGWKYILSLSRRGLWRTGLEFIRLLLQLDPQHDPLCLVLVLDQYALKSRVPQILIDLANTPVLKDTWSSSPNIAYSLSLAEFMAGNQPAAAKEKLVNAVKRFPWMLTKLHGSLSAENISGRSLPEGLWGKLPPSDTDSLLAEMYTLRMGDLWNIPEHAKFLMDTLDTIGKIDNVKEVGSAAYAYIGEKQRDLARHVFLMDQREGRGLIGFLPRGLREDQGYAWDVLPPGGGESSYQKELESEVTRGDGGGGEVASSQGGGNIFEVFLRSLMPSFQAPPQQQQPGAGGGGGGGGGGAGQGSFEVDEADLQATLINMIEDGVGFPQEMSVRDRAQLALNVGLVPLELRPWFSQQFGVTAPTNLPDGEEAEQLVVGLEHEDDDESDDEEVEQQEQQEEPVERDSRAIDRLVQILGTGDRSSLRMRVDRMFEGQGEEMAEVRRRVEERLGLR